MKFVEAKIYDIKPAARPFDMMIHDILRSLRLVEYLLKDRNAPIWRQRDPPHMRLLGTDGLSSHSADKEGFLSEKALGLKRSVQLILNYQI